MAAFAECAKQHGMMVVLKCRGLNQQSAWGLAGSFCLSPRWMDWTDRRTESLMVIITPATHTPSVNECLHEYTSEAAFEAWKLKRADKLEKEGKVIEVGPPAAAGAGH